MPTLVCLLDAALSEAARDLDLILDMGVSELRKAVGKDVLFAEYVRQPQGHCAGDLDLHQVGLFGEDLVSLCGAFETDVVIARGDVAVKGDAQVRVVLTRPCDAPVADERLGSEAVAAYHVVDLGGDVAGDAFGQLAAVDIGIGFVERHGDAALIDDAAVLLLDLEENGAVALRDAVGAEPQLLFVGGLRERGLDQLVFGIVKVDVADLGFAVFVDLHP